VAKDVSCSQSAASKMWSRYKQNGKVVKEKGTVQTRKISKGEDRKIKAISLECRKEIKTNGLREIGSLTYT